MIDFTYPDYAGGSLYNLIRTIPTLFGVEMDHTLDPAQWGGALPDVDRVVLFISDGLGYPLLADLMADDPTVADAVNIVTDGRGPIALTTIAPTTTAAVLPMVWSAESPLVTGMLGTTFFLREYATLVNLLRFEPLMGHHRSGILADWGLDPGTFVPVPSLPQRLNVPTHLLLDFHLLGTGLSRLMHRGPIETRRHAGHEDVWMRLNDVLRDTAGQRCYITGYLPNVDTLSHHYGARSDYVLAEVKQQMVSLAGILADATIRDGRTLFMVIADHGHANAPDVIYVDRDPRLNDALRMPYGGDNRFAQFYLRNDMVDTVKAVIDEDYAGRLAWFDPQQAVADGLFGPGDPHPALYHRLGDLIVAAAPGVRLADQLREPVPVSIHGGLSEAEMRVPLLWSRF